MSMAPTLLSRKGTAVFLALVVTVVCPSFFYQRYGKRLCSGLTYFNAGLFGFSIGFQEPLLLVINPLLALIGVSLNTSAKEKKHD